MGESFRFLKDRWFAVAKLFGRFISGAHRGSIR